MITYNHEKFIEQAIDGVLMQKVDFDYELIIADDASTDDTKVVVEQVLATHNKANKIRFISHSENKGMYSNFLFSLGQSFSKYIALCEGDDYWTDPLKLQRQVDFLEANPDYEVCFTNIKIINPHNEPLKDQMMKNNRKTEYETRHLPIWAPTLTRVFRNRDFSEIPNAPGLDTIMLLWQSQYGKIKLLNDITGVYRLHKGGSYSSLSVAKRKEHIILTFIASLSLIDKGLYPKYFGMLLKKLLELKPLNNEIYNKNKKVIQEQFKKHKANFELGIQFKILLAFIIISLPINYNIIDRQKMVLKILNRLLIY